MFFQGYPEKSSVHLSKNFQNIPGPTHFFNKKQAEEFKKNMISLTKAEQFY